MDIELAQSIVQGGQEDGPWISGAIGIIGAIAGSMVSVLWTEWFNRRTRVRDDRRKMSASAHAVLHKLNNIYSVSLRLKDLFHEAGTMMEAERQAYNSAPPQFDENGARLVRQFFLCLYLQSYANPPATIEFSLEELWFLPRLGGDKLLNDLSGLDRRYNAMVQSFERYGQERRILTDATRIDAADGTRVTTFTSPQEQRGQQVMMAVLDEMLEEIGEMVEELTDDSFAGLKSLTQAKAKPLGPKFEITLPSPDGDEVTIRATDGPSPNPKWFQFWKKRDSIA